MSSSDNGGAPTHYNSWEKVQLARHPQRPRTLDYVRGLCENFVELHGDRRFGDDPAIVAGLASFQGQTVAIVGHQKGKDTRENLRRSFGMPHPEGYRKALRIMRHAEKFGFPLLCFVDTPGANPNKDSEERGQAEAIAANILGMAELKIPIVATVIGEGGSGGALAIGVADRVLMLEHSVYSVASPEAAATILWRDASKAPEAAAAMRVTAQDLLLLGIIDAIVPEPEAGAHLNADASIAAVGQALAEHLAALLSQSLEQLLRGRYQKYRAMGSYAASQEQSLAELAR
jgi:acetyl-CoA carboxylase carboxyl transferase subunit alpha